MVSGWVANTNTRSFRVVAEEIKSIIRCALVTQETRLKVLILAIFLNNNTNFFSNSCGRNQKFGYECFGYVCDVFQGVRFDISL